MRRSGIKTGAKSVDRGSTLAAEPRPLRRRRYHRTASERQAAREFREQVVATGRCAMRGPHDGPLQAHHVLTVQALRRYGLAEHVWDARNGLCLCELHHARHHRALERVPRALLPGAVFEFADEVGLGWLLDREYPVGEERTDG